jgi:hypothetical protein
MKEKATGRPTEKKTSKPMIINNRYPHHSIALNPLFGY